MAIPMFFAGAADFVLGKVLADREQGNRFSRNTVFSSSLSYLVVSAVFAGVVSFLLFRYTSIERNLLSFELIFVICFAYSLQISAIPAVSMLSLKGLGGTVSIVYLLALIVFLVGVVLALDSLERIICYLILMRSLFRAMILLTLVYYTGS